MDAKKADETKVWEKTDIRIVAGTLRGRKVTAMVHPGLRPTPQMVREALFSILGNAVPGRVFYDVFAGTGIIGLEALSRGASAARFIEQDAKLATAIQKYAERFGVASQTQVLRADVYRWAERWLPPTTGPVNLFLSPPFPDLDGPKQDEFLALVQVLFDKAPLETVLTIQAENGFPMDKVPLPAAWDIRSYGRNVLMFHVKGDGVEPAGPS